MGFNEENFATGDMEDVEPSYVEQVLGNHNQDEGAHPNIRKLINQTQAFYQSAKERVEGVAEAAWNSSAEAAESASYAADEAIVASEAKAEAVAAAKEAEEVVKKYCPQIISGEWFVYNEEEGRLVPSGVVAEGKGGYTPVRGVDYWTDEDKAQIVADVLEALPSAEEVAY